MAYPQKRGLEEEDFDTSTEFDFEQDIHNDYEQNNIPEWMSDINTVPSPPTSIFNFYHPKPSPLFNNNTSSPSPSTNTPQPPPPPLNDNTNPPQPAAIFNISSIEEMEDQYEAGEDIYGDEDLYYISTQYTAKKNDENTSNHPVPAPAPAPFSPPLTKEEEDRRIQALINGSFDKWERQLQSGVGNKVGKRRAPVGLPPDGYICNRCGVEGHFIQYCPTFGDPAFDKPNQTRQYQRNQARYVNHYRHNPTPKPDEEAFDKAIQGIPTLMGAAEGSSSTKTKTLQGRPGCSTIERPKPYAGYVCFRCNIPDDHWHRDCPTYGHRRAMNAHYPPNEERRNQ